MSDLVIKYFLELNSTFMWLVGFVVFLLPVLTFLMTNIFNSRTIKQRNLELLMTVYKSGKVTNCDKFVIEHIVSDIYKRTISFLVIEALLCSSSPIKSFELYERVKHYIKITPHKKAFRVKRKYPVIKIRGYRIGYWVSIYELLWYFLSATFSFILFFLCFRLFVSLSDSIIENIPVYILIFSIAIVGILFLAIAIHFLRIQGNILHVKQFLRLQLTNASRGTVNARRFESH
ncbi:hypothetical protein [Vibrio cholerae]|uniref:hypothetical protein n=1 Tax=Vibrio cholerae TaxID=666 RepID=UPI001E45A084|nr:hypothetical protein [Vibrio cholerae]MCD6731852.1 hypothetical protein [Vibrio cholerae]